MHKFMLNNFIFNNITILFLTTAILITILTLISAWKKIKNYKSLFVINFIFFLISFGIVVSTKNWFIFMIGWEMISLTTALILIWDSKDLAWEYFVIQFVGGSFLILTILVAYTNGYHTLGPINELWLQLMFIVGVGVKSAIIGFHIWLPYIYKRASVSFCSISSALVAKLGYIILLKIITNGNRALLYLGIIMIFYGGIKALANKNYKLILSYSSISQFGFICLAIGSGNQYGYYGAVLHIIAHAFAKSTLFNTAQNWILKFKSNSIFDFSASLKELNINTISTIIAFLSLMAFPLFIGYNSKYLIKYSLNSIPIFKFLLHLGSILTVTYVFKVLSIIFLADYKEKSIEKNVELNYQLSSLENIAVLIPSIILFVLAIKPDLYLDYYFKVNYLSAFITTSIYILIAYLIKIPLISRIKNQ
ncbi:MAG: proton-conducting transporter membrane subunit [Bacillota bacterium]